MYIYIYIERERERAVPHAIRNAGTLTASGTRDPVQLRRQLITDRAQLVRRLFGAENPPAEAARPRLANFTSFLWAPCKAPHKKQYTANHFR